MASEAKMQHFVKCSLQYCLYRKTLLLWKE